MYAKLQFFAKIFIFLKIASLGAYNADFNPLKKSQFIAIFCIAFLPFLAHPLKLPFCQ
jgi:hypothetical protein